MNKDCIGEHVAPGRPEQPPTIVDATKLLKWAVERWHDEVRDRPLENVHRRTLDDTWRQVIQRLGGDDEDLIGPPHDALVAISEKQKLNTHFTDIGMNVCDDHAYLGKEPCPECKKSEHP